MNWTVLPNGDLQITVDAEEQQEFLAHLQSDPDRFDSLSMTSEILEPLVSNDEYDWVLPEWIGALTDAPILGLFGETRPVTEEDDCYRLAGCWDNEEGELTRFMDPVTDAWFYEPYAIRSPQEDLAKYGRCVFTRALSRDAE